MNDLVFPSSVFEDLKEKLLKTSSESAAILLATPVKTKRSLRLLVGEVFLPTEESYLSKTIINCQLKPEYLVPIVKKAKLQNKSLIFVHTHPGDTGSPRFSKIDDDGEIALSNFLKKRGANEQHAALVIGPKGCRARILGLQKSFRVLKIGNNFEILSSVKPGSVSSGEFDRQIRAFGNLGQQILKTLKIGIVGLGGTGSLVAEQLSYLGVENFTLIDPDQIERSNLNRVVGSNKKDLKKLKIDVAARNIKFIRPASKIVKINGSVLLEKTALLLRDIDLIFCCTDSHGSRAILNQLSYQYLIPCIDMGVSIVVQKNVVTDITGRTQLLSPSLGCLTCSGLLNADSIRYDLMSSFQRQKDPYFIGGNISAPSVISLNSTVASQAITMFLGFVTGLPVKARFQIYDGITGRVRTASTPQDPVCIVCSQRGALGKGDEWPLPARINE